MYLAVQFKLQKHLGTAPIRHVLGTARGCQVPYLKKKKKNEDNFKTFFRNNVWEFIFFPVWSKVILTEKKKKKNTDGNPVLLPIRQAALIALSATS